MSHYFYVTSSVHMAQRILEKAHFNLLYRAKDPFALFSKMNPDDDMLTKFSIIMIIVKRRQI